MLAISGILFLIQPALGQEFSTEGKDFWFGFMNNWNRDPNEFPIQLEVYISAVDTTAGILNIPNRNDFQPIHFQVLPGVATRIDLTTEQAMAEGFSGIGNKGIHLTAEKVVSVFAINKRAFSADETGILPSNSLSNEYLVMAHWETGNKNNDDFSNAELLIVATENQTTVDITPSVLTENNQLAGETFQVTLQQGETYQLMARGDLTGTKITTKNSTTNSCSNVAVFGGNQCTMVGLCGVVNGQDHLFAQMYPIKTWGQEYISVNYEPREGGDIIKILAAENNTTINLAGEVISLNAGNWAQRRVDEVNNITSNKPIAVGQFSRTQGCDGTTADPFFIMLSPNEQLLKTITFNAPNIVSTSIFSLNVIAPTDGLSKLILDDELVSNSFSTVAQNNQYSYARFLISGGNHTIESESGFIAYVYGYGDNESFGYSAGASLTNLKLNFEVRNEDGNLVPTNQICKNERLTFIPLTAYDYQLYEWDFGDDTQVSSTTKDPVYHTFLNDGSFDVQLVGNTDVSSCVGGAEKKAIRQLNVVNPILPVYGPRSVCPNTQEVLYYTANPDGLKTEWIASGGTMVRSVRDSVYINWGPTNDGAAVYLLATIPYANSCTGDSVKFDIKINLQLDPEAPIGPNTVCVSAADGITYSAYYFQGSVYDWHVEGGSISEGQGSQKVLVDWSNHLEGKIWFNQTVPGEDICGGFSDTLIVTMERASDTTLLLLPEKRVFQIDEPIELSLVADSLYEYASWLLDGNLFMDSVGLDKTSALQFSCSANHKLQINTFHGSGACTSTASLITHLTITPPQPEIIYVTSDTTVDLKLDISWKVEDDNFGDYNRVLARKGPRGTAYFAVGKNQNEFQDFGVNPAINYEYWLQMNTDNCIDEFQAVSHFNSVLNVSAIESTNEIVLKWSPYEGWKEGVETYEIYFSLDDAHYGLIGTTSSNTFVYQEKSARLDYCFRIRAIEKNGNQSYSWSNEDCVFVIPELKTYNVFTPNGDDLNPTFVIDNVEAYKKSQLIIIDRSGNTVYEQINYQNDWDGGNLPAGVYYFMLLINEPRVAQEMIKGYVHILR